MSAEVIVCGSLNTDLVARVAQLPRPGETVVGESLTRLPGGKGLNQAVAAARMGATVAMVGARGDDADGATLAALLVAEGIDTRDLRVRDTRRMPDAHTGLAQVIVAADGENSIVVHGGANLTLTAEDVTHGKPHPEIYLAAAKLLNVEPAEMLVLEDSETGTRAAAAAGAYVVSVPSRHTSSGDFSMSRLLIPSLLDERLHALLQS